MERFDPSPHIQNSQRILDIFGYWPSFHDAEIHEIRLSIADGEPWGSGSVSPVMEMQVHLFEMTKDVTPEGYFVLTKHTLAQLRFQNIENLQLSEFSFQNCIFQLEFGIQTMSYPNGRGSVDGPHLNVLTVKIFASVGLCCEFRCHSAEVISAEPCDAFGKPINSTN